MQTELPTRYLTVVNGVEGLSNETGMSMETATKLVDLMAFRESNRSDGATDILIRVDGEYSEWALESETPWMLASEVEDYTNAAGENKSFKVWSAATLDEPIFDDDEMDLTITEMISIINETDKDFIDEIGQTWVAKQYVEGMYLVR